MIVWKHLSKLPSRRTFGTRLMVRFIDKITLPLFLPVIHHLT